MNLHLVDKNESIVRAWRDAFSGYGNVTTHHGDIISVAQDTIVSPANSYGIMGGGIDAVYTQHFGTSLEASLQALISKKYAGRLPVGKALLVPTGNSIVPRMISAPTMERAQPIPPENCYLAMAALLEIVSENRNLIRDVYCPGLGTATGRVPPDVAANKMARAYLDWVTI